MESKTAETPVIQALSFEAAIAGDICPYCGKPEKDVPTHIRQCPETTRNAAAMEEQAQNRPILMWASHTLCGRVMILQYRDGLCIVENEWGRYCVPFVSLDFGATSEILKIIEDCEISTDEIEKLINILRIKSGNKAVVPKYPTFPLGSRVKVQMGKDIKTVLIKSHKGGCYQTDLCGKSVNISPKHIMGMD